MKKNKNPREIKSIKSHYATLAIWLFFVVIGRLRHGTSENKK